MDKEKRSSPKKAWRIAKKIWNIFATVLVVFVFLILCMVLVMRMTGNNGGIFGIHVNVIATGSMEPEIKVGDVIISKSYKGQTLDIGDVVSYVSRSGEMTGKLITHEIIDIQENADGLVITTKGIAAQLADDPISDKDIVSVMLYNSKVIGFIYGIVTTPIGFVVIVILPLALTVFFEARSFVKQCKTKEKATDNTDKEENKD